VLTFKHSGDLGDIIFSLPVIRALGGGVLMLDPEGGKSEPLCDEGFRKGTHLDARRAGLMLPLLRKQPYLHDVTLWKGEKVDHNLDEFRRHLQGRDNLVDSHLAAFGLSPSERDTPWLTVPDPIAVPGRRFVLHRSVRHQGNFRFWYSTMPQIADRSIFIGVEKEHEIFEYTFEIKVPFQPTADILEMARYVAGAQQFIGNASLPHALAQAMHLPKIVLEVDRMGCDVVFKRPGVQFV
jgi:hypothetical protein